MSGSYQGKYSLINVDMDVDAFRVLHSSGAIRRSIPGPPTYNQPVADVPGLRHPVPSCSMCVRPTAPTLAGMSADCLSASPPNARLRLRASGPVLSRREHAIYPCENWDTATWQAMGHPLHPTASRSRKRMWRLWRASHHQQTTRGNGLP